MRALQQGETESALGTDLVPTRTPWYTEYQQALIEAGHVPSNSSHKLRFNAIESWIVIEGFNFGRVVGSSSVYIGGKPCSPVTGSPTVWKIGSNDDPIIECIVSGLTVGNHDIYIEVASQQVYIPAEDARVFGECPPGFFGTEEGNHTCISCPTCETTQCFALGEQSTQASICDGGTTAPYAASRFWMYQGTNKINTTRGYGLDICIPTPEGLNPCLVGNRCKLGYIEENACSVCKTGF